MAKANPTLHRILYRSRQTAAAAADLDHVVQDIIGVSVPRNRVVGLTGLLLSVQGSFIQALEGRIDAVRGAYARISTDPRHHDLHILCQGPAEQRLFGEWDMCASSLAPSDKAIVDVLDGRGRLNLQTLSAVSAQQLLTTVAAIRRRTTLTTLVG